MDFIWILRASMFLAVLLEVTSFYNYKMLIILYPYHWFIIFSLTSVCCFIFIFNVVGCMFVVVFQEVIFWLVCEMRSGINLQFVFLKSIIPYNILFFPKNYYYALSRGICTYIFSCENINVSRYAWAWWLSMCVCTASQTVRSYTL